MRRVRLRAIGVTLRSVVIASVALGCSQQPSADDRCGAGSPCGGNLVGTWNMTGACRPQGSPAPLLPGCADASGVLIPELVTGQLTFNADSTYSVSLQLSAIETFSVPISCPLSEGGPPVPCENIARATMIEWQQLDAGPMDVTCATGYSTCECSAGITVAFSQSGRYATSGSSYALTPDGASSSTGGGGYCVQGANLRLLGSQLMGGRALFGEMQGVKD